MAWAPLFNERYKDEVHAWIRNVLPGYYRRGIGRRLLDLAKAISPSRLFLYTFLRNTCARAFYESQRFRCVARTEGSRNEEREPDVGYE